MARIGSGVEIRAKSIRFTFIPGKPTLRIDGKSVKPTPPNVAWAYRLAADVRNQMKRGTFSQGQFLSGLHGDSLTVEVQLQTLLAVLRVEKSTREGYRSVAAFWIKHIGDRPIRDLKHSEVMRVLARHCAMSSGKTVNNRTSVLRRALGLAVRDKLLVENPMAGLVSAKWQRNPPDLFTTDEAEAIIESMREHYPAQVANYVEFKFFTGLRSGESFGLRWPSIDIERQRMTITESVVGGEEKRTTKTKSVRTVKLNSQALKVLERQKWLTFQAGMHVFHDPRTGKRWSGEPTFRRFWVDTLLRLQIRHRPPYNTRHTYATMMFMGGLPSACCADQMGHSVDLFHSTYTKWLPGAGDDLEMAKLEQAIKRIGNSDPATDPR